MSIATAVFPVCLSPIINSLCPLPIGIIESIALMPVCNGSFTGCLNITPGAFLSSGIEKTFPLISPLPSIGFPNVSRTLPQTPSPTFSDAISPDLFTVSPSLIELESPIKTAPTLSSSKLRTKPLTPPPNSNNSPAFALDKP